MLQYERINVSEGIDTKKSNKSKKKEKKNAWFVIIGILKILVINLKHISVKNGMVYQWWLKN